MVGMPGKYWLNWIEEQTGVSNLLVDIACWREVTVHLEYRCKPVQREAVNLQAWKVLNLPTGYGRWNFPGAKRHIRYHVGPGHKSATFVMGIIVRPAVTIFGLAKISFRSSSRIELVNNPVLFTRTNTHSTDGANVSSIAMIFEVNSNHPFTEARAAYRSALRTE